MKSWFFLFLVLSGVSTARADETATEVNKLATNSPALGRQVEKEDEDILQRLYPFYALYGHNEIKLEVSFKTPLVKHIPLYFGYTQLMFYDFYAHTKLFRDLTYNPQLFYTIPVHHMGIFKSVDIGFFDHNSNGKPLPDHRSYNDAYVRGNWELDGTRWLTRASVEAQYLYAFQTTNLDIQNYIGPLVFKLTFIQLFEGWVDKSEISLQAIPGGKFADRWDTGGYQLSWAFRLGGINLVPSFYLQWYEGYAETLINYNQRENVFRGGFLF